MRYYFTTLLKREEPIKDYTGLSEHVNILFSLMDRNLGFLETKLFDDLKRYVVEAMRNDLYEGHLLVGGTNATLFGNGTELLLKTVGEFDGKSTLKNGEVRCKRFKNGVELVCARSPHITMGNLYLAKNVLDDGIWDYFDLGDNVVCVNAINENIQQRLNGCDYDSDVMLMCDDPLVVKATKRYYDLFKTPVCAISEKKSSICDPVDIDALTSENKIGEIVNLSQRLNSLIWDRINKGESWNKVKEIYYDVCVLAVLSGIEIDKAKRSFNVDATEVLNKIRIKYWVDLASKPLFFKKIDEKYKVKEEGGKSATKTHPRKYETAMDYIFANVANMTNYRKGKPKTIDYKPLSSLFAEDVDAPTRNDYFKADVILKMNEEYRETLTSLRVDLRKHAGDDLDVRYENFIDQTTEMRQRIISKITGAPLLKALISRIEKGKCKADWLFYAALLQPDSEQFKALFKKSDKKLNKVIEMPTGSIKLFGFEFELTDKNKT